MDAEDLRSHESRWVEPIFIDYHSKHLDRTFRIFENPLNSQAVVALRALKIIQNCGLHSNIQPGSVEYFDLVKLTVLCFTVFL